MQRDDGDDQSIRATVQQSRPASVVSRRQHRDWGVNDGAGDRAGAARRGAKNAMDRYASERRVSPEPSPQLQQVGERAAGLKIVQRRAAHRAGQLHACIVHWDEHDVTGLEADVMPSIPTQ